MTNDQLSITNRGQNQNPREAQEKLMVNDYKNISD